MRSGWIGIVTATALATLVAVGGCGSNSNGGGAGGATSSGGSASGGSTSSGGSGSGGATGSGGSASGGSTSSGGSSGTGGANATGGSTGSGGSSGGSSGTSITTVSGSKTLGSLSTDDAKKLCDDTYAYFNKTISQSAECKWVALFYSSSSSAPTEAALKQGCTDHQTACMSADAGAGAIANPGCDPLPSNCTATVAQFSTCLSDHAADFVKTVEGLSTCAALTKAALNPVQDAVNKAQPASCTTIVDICPALSIPNLYYQ